MSSCFAEKTRRLTGDMVRSGGGTIIAGIPNQLTQFGSLLFTWSREFGEWGEIEERSSDWLCFLAESITHGHRRRSTSVEIIGAWIKRKNFDELLNWLFVVKRLRSTTRSFFFFNYFLAPFLIVFVVGNRVSRAVQNAVHSRLIGIIAFSSANNKSQQSFRVSFIIACWVHS